MNKKSDITKLIFRLSIGVLFFVAVLAILMNNKNIAVLNPKGSFAQNEYNLIVLTVSVMLAVLIPTLIVLYSFAWHYKAGNKGSKYNNPNLLTNKYLVLVLWAIPLAVLAILAPPMWRDTHKYTPKQSFNSTQKPLEVQVIAMEWKWLFIYPEQNIASVNYVKIPVDRPVHFKLTADHMPMSSFWVPNLAGMLYVMTGHVNQLNILADKAGQYPGKSSEINGKGYAGMEFTVDATTQKDFDEWVASTKSSSSKLSDSEYSKLVAPSENNPVRQYHPVQSDLFSKIIVKYHPSDMHSGHDQNKAKPSQHTSSNADNTPGSDHEMNSTDEMTNHKMIKEGSN